MKSLIALFVGVAFALSTVGMAAAQAKDTKTETKTEKTEKMEKKTTEKKETKADCLKMAKDDAAKADCDKKFPKKASAKTETKTEKTEKTETKTEKK